MTQRRAAARTQTNPPAQQAPQAGSEFGVGNSQGARVHAQQEVARQQQAAEQRATGQYMPWRMRLKVGEQGDVVVLDRSLDDLMFVNEHQLQGSDGKWNTFELCPKEWDSCTLCQQYKDSYYVMMLSVIDWRQYTNKDGAVIQHSKKILAVKAAGMQDFFRLADAAMAQHGTLRGMHLVLSRDNNRELNTGHPIMFDNGTMFEMLSEDELLQNFGHPEEKGQDGTVFKQANADIAPLNFAQLFQRPSGEDLRNRYGGQAPAGSTQANNDGWGSPVQPVANQPAPPVGDAPPVGEPEQPPAPPMTSAAPPPQTAVPQAAPQAAPAARRRARTPVV